MAWIRTIREDEWGGPLADLYGQVVDADHGRVQRVDLHDVVHPAAMAGHLAVYGSAMAGTKTLRKVERELVALVVSRYNDCHY